MAKVFIYFPFSNYQADPAAGDMVDFQNETDSIAAFETIVSGGGNPLAKVGDDDLLMSVSHGDIDHPDEMYLCTASATTVKTANDFADQLVAQGLPKTHQSILMMNCWAGGDSAMKPGKAPDMGHATRIGQTAPGDIAVTKNSYLKCLASTVAKALGGRGYSNIVVGGFPGVVTLSVTLGRTGFKAGAERVLAQIDHIQWYDSQGQNTVTQKAPVGRAIGRSRSNAFSTPKPTPAPRRAVIGGHRA